MSVAGTKNFDQPPHDSNRTHLVFSTSGLLLGSRAPLVVETAWERYARDESADGTVMLPCYVWSCRGAAAAGRETETKLPCYLQLLGVDVGERDCGDESADAAVGGRCGGARLRRRICGRCRSHAICGCWG